MQRAKLDLEALKEAVNAVSGPRDYNHKRNTIARALEESPSETITWILPKLKRFIENCGYKLIFSDNPISHLAPDMQRAMRAECGENAKLHGYCDRDRKNIVIDTESGPDFQVRTVIHEMAHMLGAHTKYASDDELVAESVAYAVCRELGYDSSAFSAMYCAVYLHMEMAEWNDTMTEDIFNTIMDAI
jgi:hypothetical protein